MVRCHPLPTPSIATALAVMQPVLIRRIGAYVLDIVLLFIILAPLGYLVQRAMGIGPESAQGVYVALILNFSLPAWTYFALADRSHGGATLGKHWLSLRTEADGRRRVGRGQALVRTAVKMVPWEIAHASSFLFTPALGEFTVGNWIGIGASYTLSFVYLFIAWCTRGHRSLHDFAASTSVEQASASSEAKAL